MTESEDTANLYRVATTRRSVTLAMIGGESLRGHVFVHSSAYRPFEPEDAAELFNAGEPFLALELWGGGVTLVAKERVAEVEVEAAGDDDGASDDTGIPRDEDTTPMAHVQLSIEGGRVIQGSIRLDVRPGRARVLDSLNHLSTRFVTVFTGGVVRLVNRSLIDHVRTQD
jgi:hypothetical protein